jgi:hypothetical protein
MLYVLCFRWKRSPSTFIQQPDQEGISKKP